MECLDVPCHLPVCSAPLIQGSWEGQREEASRARAEGWENPSSWESF